MLNGKLKGLPKMTSHDKTIKKVRRLKTPVERFQ